MCTIAICKHRLSHNSDPRNYGTFQPQTPLKTHHEERMLQQSWRVPHRRERQRVPQHRVHKVRRSLHMGQHQRSPRLALTDLCNYVRVCTCARVCTCVCTFVCVHVCLNVIKMFQMRDHYSCQCSHSSVTRIWAAFVCCTHAFLYCSRSGLGAWLVYTRIVLLLQEIVCHFADMSWHGK